MTKQQQRRQATRWRAGNSELRARVREARAHARACAYVRYEAWRDARAWRAYTQEGGDVADVADMARAGEIAPARMTDAPYLMLLKAIPERATINARIEREANARALYAHAPQAQARKHARLARRGLRAVLRALGR